MSSWELLPQVLFAAKCIHLQSCTLKSGLASHQKSVIYIVFSNNMSNEFIFFHIHYFVIMIIPHEDTKTIKCVIREISTFYKVGERECVCVVLVVEFCSHLCTRAKLA